MAMLAVLMCTVVVVALSAVAVRQSFESLSVTAQGRQLVQTVDAAHAGIEAELAALGGVYSSPGGTAIPCADGSVTAATSADPAGRASYTLSMSDPGTKDSALSSGLYPCSAHGFAVPDSLTPWYVVVQSSGLDSATSGGHTGRTIQALVRIDDSASAPTTTTITAATTTTTTTTTPSTTTTTVPATTYSSNASAVDLDLALLGSTVALTLPTPPTTASNDGSGSNSPVTSQPLLSIPAADGFLGASLLSSTAEANTDGSSYACASVLSSGGKLTGGSATAPCATSGNASGGVTLNLLGLPGVGSVFSNPILSGVSVSGLTLHVDAVTSWATGAAAGASFSGDATLLDASVSLGLSVLGLGVTALTLPLSLPSTVTSSTDLVSAITNAIAGSTSVLGLVSVGSLAAPIATLLDNVVSLTADYHNLAGGVYTVSALHVALLSNGTFTGATADLARSRVGPNTVNTPVTTTTSTTSTTSTTAPPPTTSTTAAEGPGDGITVLYMKQVP